MSQDIFTQNPNLQELQKEYEDKFGEVPAESFTKAQLEEAIAKDEPLVAELKND